MKYIVLSCSLRPDSNSSVMARFAHDLLKQGDHDATLYNLQDYDLPICDGGDCYSHPSVLEISKKIEAADGILIATPIYNFDVSASTKNLLELTGQSWNEKVVGFICAAGGQGSYMSAMPFANSLMLDYRCIIIPRYVFATRQAFDGDKITEPAIKERLEELTQNLIKFTESLRQT